jgi:predicted AlkP superfamily phosphohydrolase/phosphomutase
MSHRVLVIGLDGATPGLVQSLMDEGNLPNIRNLASSGVCGRLSSVIPYVSPVSWASFMTGNGPGSHGIFGFQRCIFGDAKSHVYDAGDVRGDTLWRILSDNNKRVIVVNVPMTYPPEDVNGVLIGGMPSPGITVKPGELRTWLEEEGYVVEGRGFMNTGKDVFLESLYRATDKQVDVSLKLMDRIPDWDFHMIVIPGTDRIQHYMWGDMEDKHPKYGRAIQDYYGHVDNLLGRLIKKAGGNTTVIVLSDHGFSRLRKRVHINHWLIENGFMKIEDTWGNRCILFILRLSGFLKDAGVSGFIRNALIRVSKGRYGLKRPPKVSIDYSKNTSVSALSYFTGNLWFNPGMPYPEYLKEREKLITKLKELGDPDTGEKIIKEVYRREDIYEGNQLSGSPDIILVPNNDSWIVGELNYYKLIETVTRVTGRHTRDGVIILSGPSVKKTDALIKAGITDVAPTILHLFGIKAEMGGRVIEEVLK